MLKGPPLLEGGVPEVDTELGVGRDRLGPASWGGLAFLRTLIFTLSEGEALQGSEKIAFSRRALASRFLVGGL